MVAYTQRQNFLCNLDQLALAWITGLTPQCTNPIAAQYNTKKLDA